MNASSLVGQQVGPYQLTRMLGEGGMASVYEGEQAAMGRRVAVKVLLPELNDNQQIVGRFVNEAKALGRINHPGVVSVFDVSATPDGRMCLVMELLSGKTLYQWRHERTQVSQIEALPLMLQLCATMQAAHDAGIVHRDLKPENVFVVDDPLGPRTKVLDFGIAKLAEGAGHVVTATTSRFGTGAFMPPEQFRSSKDVDARADIYALGCVFFHLFAGRPPFLGENMGQQMHQHVTEQPPALSSVAAGSSPQLDAIIARMLAKDRHERYPSMSDVGAALTALAGATSPLMPAAFKSTPPIGEAQQPTEHVDAPAHGRSLIIAVIAVLVVVAVGVVVVLAS
jgi:serine/threonine-protein kinase